MQLGSKGSIKLGLAELGYSSVMESFKRRVEECCMRSTARFVLNGMSNTAELCSRFCRTRAPSLSTLMAWGEGQEAATLAGGQSKPWATFTRCREVNTLRVKNGASRAAEGQGILEQLRCTG